MQNVYLGFKNNDRVEILIGLMCVIVYAGSLFFPLLDKEQEVYKKLGLSEVTVHTALDEPLMKTFGSETISL